MDARQKTKEKPKRSNLIMIAPPCTAICQIDKRSGLCIGCARTLDEIALWESASDDEQRDIIAKLPTRLIARALQDVQKPQ
jgi:uncharacterized protein